MFAPTSLPARCLSCWIVVAILCVNCNGAFIYTGGLYEQNFNSLQQSGTHTWIDDVTLAGWHSTESTYQTSDGITSGSGLYSYGVTGDSDRGLGSLTSNAKPQIQFALQMQNNTGQTITEFSLSYFGEQWRGSGQSRQNFLTFDYRLDATAGVNVNLGTNVEALKFGSLHALGPSSSALNGNLDANRSFLSATITGITWSQGEFLTLRWTDNKLAGNNHGLAIDDFAFTTNVAAAPEPMGLFWLGSIAIAARQIRRTNKKAS